ATVSKTAPSWGIEIPEAINPLYNAFSIVSAYPIASPVDFISGPSVVSTLRSFSKENTGTFTDTNDCSSNIPAAYPKEDNVSPSIHFVAIFAIGTDVILLKKGIVRLALGFTSSTYTSSF